MNTPKQLSKKQGRKVMKEIIHMNDSSIVYLNSLLSTHHETFTDEEKENLGNLLRYLDETLNPYFKSITP